MSQVKNLRLRDVHLANSWVKDSAGRILQVRGTGYSYDGEIPVERIATGMHVKIGDHIDAILVLSGGRPGEMISSGYWNDAAIDVSGQVDIVAADAVAPAAARSLPKMTLGALYRHKDEPAFFIYAELDGGSAFRGAVCVESWTDKWRLGTCPTDLRASDLVLIAEKAALSNEAAIPLAAPLAEAAE